MIEVTCASCGKQFIKKTAEVKRSPVHCCSRQCAQQRLRMKSAAFHETWRFCKPLELTQSVLREHLHYDQESGNFTRLQIAHSSHSGYGYIAGSIDSAGYLRISVTGKQYKAHRLAWLYMTGAWPTGEIDHINGIRSDNRWLNLRDVSKRINQQNRRKARPSTASGLLGVSFVKNRNRYVARITVDGQLKVIGFFKDAESAHAAYLDAKRVLHVGNTI